MVEQPGLEYGVAHGLFHALMLVFAAEILEANKLHVAHRPWNLQEGEKLIYF